MKHSNIKSVCILRLTALGDCINAFGVVNAIHENYPDVKLRWVIDSRFASLFISNDSPIVPLAPVDIKKKGILKSVFSLRKILNNEKFDVLLNMQTSIKASLLSTVIKASEKFGYDKGRRRECQGLFINRYITVPASPHVLSGFISFARSSGFENIIPKWDYHFTAEEIFKAKKLLPASEKLFVIAPASAKVEKNWTADGYIEVTQHAIDKGFNVVIVGSNGKQELELCNHIADSLHNNCTNLCGKTSLRILAAIISLSKLVLSPDSASMHLASSLNIPVIGLFAIHCPDRVGAWNFRKYEVSVYREMVARELGDKPYGWRYRVKNKDAMKEISPCKVIETFDQICADYLLT